MYGQESWTIKKPEHQRIDAFKLWYWRSVPWTTKRSNQSILKETNPKYSLQGLILKLKLQYFGPRYKEQTHWKRPWCWERLKAKRKGATEDEMVRQHHWLSEHEFEQTPGDSRTDPPGVVQSTGWRRVRHDLATEQQGLKTVSFQMSWFQGPFHTLRWMRTQREVFYISYIY